MARFLWIMNSTGTKGWRVFPIQKALEEEGHETQAINMPKFTDDLWKDILDYADVIVFQMVASRELVADAKKRGIYTVFDCDDLIDEVPPKHPQFEVTKERGYQNLFKHMMKTVDLVTVSSHPLYELYTKYNPNIQLLPNYIPDYFWERPKSPNSSSTLRLGWAGGVSHQEDLDFISPVIHKVLTAYPQVKFVYTGGGGWTGSGPNSHIHFGEDHFKDIPLYRREWSMGSRLETWPAKLNSMRLDIALAPLARNRFSESKTHIKYFEYGINSWAGVYQDFLYGDVVKHGSTGFLASTEEEWYNAIELLINNHARRTEIGDAAYRDVKDHYTFERNRDEWLDCYRRAAARSTKGTDAFFISGG